MNINEWLNFPTLTDAESEAPQSFIPDDSDDWLGCSNPDFDPVDDPRHLVGEIVWAAKDEGNYSAAPNPESIYLGVLGEECLEVFWCDEYAEYYGVNSYEEYLAL